MNMISSKETVRMIYTINYYLSLSILKLFGHIYSVYFLALSALLGKYL
jgi:hypothetical protein